MNHRRIGVVAISIIFVAFFATAYPVHADIVRADATSTGFGFFDRHMYLQVQTGDLVVFTCQTYTDSSNGTVGSIRPRPGDQFDSRSANITINGVTGVGGSHFAFLGMQSEGNGGLNVWAMTAFDTGLADVHIPLMQDYGNYGDACSAVAYRGTTGSVTHYTLSLMSASSTPLNVTSPGSWLVWANPYGGAPIPPTSSMQGLDTGYSNILQDSNGAVSPGTYQVPGILMEIQPSAPPPPPACTVSCYDNILFLPGIESSRLYRPDGMDGEKRVWEPTIIGHDNTQLAMTSSGISMESDIYTKDPLDTVLGIDIYGSFLSTMQQFARTNDLMFETFPYDWRYAVDVVASSSTRLATTTVLLLDEVKKLAAESKTGKITIIAHSNGGLVGKALMTQLGADATRYIDRVIFVAVPQTGTPQAVAGLLHGYNQAIPMSSAPLLISDAEARSLGIHMPGIYGLLPSAGYFTSVTTPIITFATSTLSDWVSRYGNTITSQSHLNTFLTDNAGRVVPVANDLNNPEILSSDLLAQSQTLHQIIDAWTPPAGVELIQIAGWGIPTTVSGIEYSKNSKGIKPTPSFTIDGDGTVVVPSALWTSETTGGMDYWLNLRNYNTNHPLQTVGGFVPFNHASILAVKPLSDFISDIIASTTRPLNDYSYLSTNAPLSLDVRLRYALHSPLTLDLYDDQGNHTGMSTTTGEVVEQIPGTYYVQFGDVKYIFADEGEPHHLVMSGYDTGTFTFEISELQGDGIVASMVFKDVPVTPQTKVTFDIASGLSSASDLSVDENGDGTVDATYASSTGQLVVILVPEPAPPPQLESPTPQSGGGGGGGGIPSLLPQGGSGSLVVATSTTAISTHAVSSTTPLLTSSTTTTARASQASSSVSLTMPSKVVARTVVKSASSAIAKGVGPNAQVAAVAQTTGDGLWKRAWGWIMKKIQRSKNYFTH
ncbi:MAG: hypothetical protein Q8R25_03350 [bacterium]|nr:hypothetical protein [bacterium]